jgi:hypothetical protein
MKVEKQLAIFLANKPGTLAQVCRVLAKERINILAMTVSDTVDHAVVRMVVSDAHRAVHLLGDAGVLVVENDVLTLELPNKPGALAQVAAKLAAAKVNIEYAYGTGVPNQNKSMVIIRTRNLKKAIQVLKR